MHSAVPGGIHITLAYGFAGGQCHMLSFSHTAAHYESNIQELFSLFAAVFAVIINYRFSEVLFSFISSTFPPFFKKPSHWGNIITA